MTWKSMCRPYLLSKALISFYWPACSVGLLEKVAKLTEPAALAGTAPDWSPVVSEIEPIVAAAMAILAKERDTFMRFLLQPRSWRGVFSDG